jgi:hypothetical protein
MNESHEPDASNRTDRPGKTRTWWHPLLARLLDHTLASAYTVRDEVLVGKLPLRVDILLIRREAGQLSEAGRRDLSALVPLLNRFTLIEFKGPTDALEPGDLAQLAGCSFLWHSQQVERLPQADVSLIVLAPRINDAARDEVRCLGWDIEGREAGVYRVGGGPFTMWLVETNVMAERGQPILSLVSGLFLNEHRRIIVELGRSGHSRLLNYMLQQVGQFRSLGEDFAMQHKDSEYLDELEEELQTAVLEAIPVEKRLQGLPPEELLRGLPPEVRLRGLPPEERLRGLRPEELLRGLSPEERLRGLPPEELLRGLPPEELLRGLSPEELAAGLSEEQAARLRELLERRQGK